MKRRRLIVPASSAPPLVASSFAGPADPPAPNVAPRMPSLPSSIVYAPPAAEVARVLAQQVGTGDAATAAGEPFEAFTQTVPLADLSEMTVYTTQRRWRACDVFVAVPGGRDFLSIVTVRVYAVTLGARVLVASGRLGPGGEILSNLATDRPTWIAAARSLATKFEVTLIGGPPASVSGLEMVEVSVVASDQAVQPVEDVGACLLRGPDQGVTTSAGTALNLTADRGWPDVELLDVFYAIDPAVAAHRYVQVFDSIDPPVGGSIPLLSWDVHGALQNPPAARIQPRYRFRLNGFVRASSTFDSLTEVLDLTFNLRLR